MSDAEQRLVTDRGNRNSARGLFEQRLTRVKADLAARSIPGRVKEGIQEQVFSALDHGVDVAKESKGIIAATSAAVALWFFRQPLIEMVTDWLDKNSETGGEPDSNVQEEQHP